MAWRAVEICPTRSVGHVEVRRPPRPPFPQDLGDGVHRLGHNAESSFGAHSYLVVVPGARPHVDAAFDTIDQLRDTHGDEVNRIVGDGYEEVRVIIRDAGAMDASTAMKVLDVLRRRSAELEELGKKAGKDAFGSLSERYPQVSEKLGGGYDELKRLAETKGPEAKKIFDDTTKQVRMLR